MKQNRTQGLNKLFFSIQKFLLLDDL